MESDDRFKTLDRLGKFVAGMGWVIGVLGSIIGLMMMVTVSGYSGRGIGVFTGLLVIASSIITGLLVVAAGQTMQCFVAIEKNTRTHYYRNQDVDQTNDCSMNNDVANGQNTNRSRQNDSHYASIDQVNKSTHDKKNLSNYLPTAPVVDVEYFITEYAKRRDVPWADRLTSWDKDNLRRLAETFRENLNMQDWTDITREYKEDPESDFEKYLR
jgi:hypothetical protein